MDTVQESYQKGLAIYNTKGSKENPDGSRNITMRVSIEGLIHRVNTAKRISEVRGYRSDLASFVKNYAVARQAFEQGNLELVGEFFMFYVAEVEKEENGNDSGL